MTRQSIRRTKLLALAFATAAALATGSAFAAPHHESPWHGDIHRFHEHDWVAGGTYYFYPAPVYPYPSPWEPPAVDLVTPPVASAPPPPPTQYWYFCRASNQYYPYAATCPGGWEQVPAMPAPHG